MMRVRFYWWMARSSFRWCVRTLVESLDSFVCL